MLKTSMDTYNDGVVSIMEATTSRSTVGINPSGTDGLDLIRTMAYNQMSRQEKDVELADDEGFELTAKLKVRHVGDVTPEMFCLLGSRLCEIGHVDDDRVHDFLYLSEIKTDGTVQLLAKKTVVDDYGIESYKWDGPMVYVRQATKQLTSRFDALAQTLNPSMTLVIRACDYGNQPKVSRANVTYSVTSTSSDGRWIRLVCERGTV
jgi:SPP1 family predicted phage head-tail adaptor